MKSDINIKPKFSQNGSFRSLSFNNGSSLDHPQVSSIPHNSCFLVNGKERKLSNSYLRFQRRYSKHGWVTLTRWQFTGCSIWKMTKWKRCRTEISSKSMNPCWKSQNVFTGCPTSIFEFSTAYNSESMHFWLHVSKDKMLLRCVHSFENCKQTAEKLKSTDSVIKPFFKLVNPVLAKT